MKRVSSVSYDANVTKTSFMFGHGPGQLFMAPERAGAEPSAVSSIAFAPPKRHKKAQPYEHLSISGKLVLKVRQFPGMNSFNWSKCFPPGAVEAMRASNPGPVTFTFNPPLVCKESEDLDKPVDVVATVVQPAEMISPLSDADSSGESESPSCSAD